MNDDRSAEHDLIAEARASVRNALRILDALGAYHPAAMLDQVLYIAPLAESDERSDKALTVLSTPVSSAKSEQVIR
jgi:hypothetical protein